MKTNILLLSPQESQEDSDFLHSLKIFHLTTICHSVKDVAKNIGAQTKMLLISPFANVDNRMLDDFLPKFKLPPVYNIKELLSLKQQYGVTKNAIKCSMLSIEFFIHQVNAPHTSDIPNILKHCLHIMSVFNLEAFSYKLLKFVCCMLGKEYNLVMNSIRTTVKTWLKQKNSKYLNRMFLGTDGDKINTMSIINYCYKKYINNLSLFNKKIKPDYYNINYYLTKQKDVE